jgi:hypothetical protein
MAEYEDCVGVADDEGVADDRQIVRVRESGCYAKEDSSHSRRPSASTEQTTERFTHTDTTAQTMTGSIVAVRGPNPVTPEDAPVVRTSGQNNRQPNGPTLTTVSPSDLVLVHEGVTGSAMSKVVAPFGTMLLQATQVTNGNSGVSIFFDATAGLTGTGQWLNSGGSSGADFHVRAVAIRPL